MPQTQVACPQCRRTIPANIEQMFDVTQDPPSKQRLLGGLSNMARCPHCGYQGRLATPIVYHDADKELLLTYFPAELRMPVNEQERMVGPLIKQVMDRLPAEKRKGYLLNPVANLTYESMLEVILGKDGITPEMIKAQQERLLLVERLLQAKTPALRTELMQQNEKLIDEQFFALFSRLLQGAAASGQENAAKEMSELQKQLLAETALGRQLQESVGELEAASKALQEAGPNLTREKLLELVESAHSEAGVRAYVGFARGGMDYAFFQTLTERIDRATGDKKKALEALRAKLLEYVAEADRQVEERRKQAEELVEAILAEEDVEAATRRRLGEFTQDTVDFSSMLMRQASEKNDYMRMGRLQKLLQVLQDASAPPPEVAFIERLLEAADNPAVETMLRENDDLVNDQFMEALGGLVNQMRTQASKGNVEARALSDKLDAVYKAALAYSMKKRLA